MSPTLLRELIHIRVQISPHGSGSDLIGARRTAETEIDSPGMQRGQSAKLLGNDQWCMVWQHDAASPDPNGARAGGNMRQSNRRGGARNARHVVMFRHPVSLIAQCLDMAGQIERVPQRLASVAAFRHGCKVEDR